MFRFLGEELGVIGGSSLSDAARARFLSSLRASY